MGYVRFDQNAPWPPNLQVKPVTQIPWNPTGAIANANDPK